MAVFAEQIQGLSAAEVQERSRRGERNLFIARPTRTYGQILLENVFNLYNIILLGSFLVLLIIRGLGASIFPALVVLTNMVLGIVQEIRAKRALDKLATLHARTVTVRRAGKTVPIPLEQIVCDEVIEVHPGDSIVADGPILASAGLEIDESQLTGESEYVPKHTGEDVLSGSFCVSGQALMRAERIGKGSFVNHLAEVARAYRNVRTPLERSLDRLLEILIVIMAVLAPLTLVNGAVHKLPLGISFENLVNLISSLVPQGLIVFVAISFAYGVIKIARFNALIQRPNAIESMGHITCLCMDKTGTLTRNILAVKQIIPLNNVGRDTIEEKLRRYVSSVSYLNKTAGAIAATLGGTDTSEPLKDEVPFNSERKWSSISLADGETLLLGAPELFTGDTELKDRINDLSQNGLRMVMFSRSGQVPDKQNPVIPSEHSNLALIALEDQLRPDICETLNGFERQGVTLKVISGDSPETIRSIAQQACMDTTRILTGPEVEKLDGGELDEAVSSAQLFARITPQSKSKIIAALKKRAYVAMIGDGVNDVPALKQADVAIAMNDGAQIAKDVSDITLLNNEFSTLPKAFEEGRELTRRIYGIARINLQKVVYLTILFVLTGYIGFAWPASLIQTTWLSLITLTAPALLIIFRILPAPKGRNEPGEFLRYMVKWGLVGALAMILLEIVVQLWFKQSITISQTVVMVFAGIFNSIVLWDIYGITPYRPHSIIENSGSFIAGLVLAIISGIGPSFLFPKPFGFTRLMGNDWGILLIVLAISYSAAYFLGDFQFQRKEKVEKQQETL